MEHFDEKAQNTNRADGDSLERYGSGVLPDGTMDTYVKSSPIINYTYARTRPIIERLMKAGDIDQCMARACATPIRSPAGTCMPTMGAYLAMFPKGFKGKDYQSTDGADLRLRRRPRQHQGRRQGAGVGSERRVRGAVVAQIRARREGRGGAVLDLRQAGAGSARHLARAEVSLVSAFRNVPMPRRQAGRFAYAGAAAAALPPPPQVIEHQERDAGGDADEVDGSSRR